MYFSSKSNSFVFFDENKKNKIFTFFLLKLKMFKIRFFLQSSPTPTENGIVIENSSASQTILVEIFFVHIENFLNSKKKKFAWTTKFARKKKRKKIVDYGVSKLFSTINCVSHWSAKHLVITPKCITNIFPQIFFDFEIKFRFSNFSFQNSLQIQFQINFSLKFKFNFQLFS